MSKGGVGIVIIGGGYVGLSTAAYFLPKEHIQSVTIIESNKERREKLIKHEMPIYEPGLDRYFIDYKEKFSIKASVNEIEPSVDFIFLCVGTPYKENGSCDLNNIESSVSSLNDLAIPLTVVIKSTVPPMTADILQAQFTNLTFLNNPEFLREGCAVQDIETMNRIVLGGPSKAKLAPLVDLYLKSHPPEHLHITNNRTAELMKLASNYMLATRINAINAVAVVSNFIKGNIKEVEAFLKTDPRLGDQYMSASIGFGGSCFPKDVLNLASFISIANFKNYQSVSRQIRSQYNVNLDQLKLLEPYPDPANHTVGLLGTAFKEDTDDIREAPSVRLGISLLQAGHDVNHYDPHSSNNYQKEFVEHLTMKNSLVRHDSVESLLQAVNVLYIMNKNKECIAAIKNLPQNITKIYDCVNLFEVPPKGIEYHSVGFYGTFPEE